MACTRPGLTNRSFARMIGALGPQSQAGFESPTETKRARAHEETPLGAFSYGRAAWGTFGCAGVLVLGLSTRVRPVATVRGGCRVPCEPRNRTMKSAFPHPMDARSPAFKSASMLSAELAAAIVARFPEMFASLPPERAEAALLALWAAELADEPQVMLALAHVTGRAA